MNQQLNYLENVGLPETSISVAFPSHCSWECRASAGACQCALPVDAHCHAPSDTWWQKQCHPIT